MALYYNHNKLNQYRENIKMNYNLPNTSYKFFTYTPSQNGKEFSPLKIKVVFNKATKEVIDFYWKPSSFAFHNGYILTQRTKERHSQLLKAMQDQNIVL